MGVSFEASIKGPEITIEDGRLVLEWGGNTISSVKLDGVLDNFAQLVDEVEAHEQEAHAALKGTLTLPLAGGGTVSTSVTPDTGISVTVSSHGISTTVGLKLPDTFYVTTSGSKSIPLRPPLKPVDVDVDATVEFTPIGGPEPKQKPATNPAINPKPALRRLPDQEPVSVVGDENGADGVLSGTNIAGFSSAFAENVDHGR